MNSQIEGGAREKVIGGIDGQGKRISGLQYIVLNIDILVYLCWAFMSI